MSEDEKPRAWTRDEVQTHFLNHCRHLIDYWARQEDRTERQKIEGVVFSLLVALDGEADLPSFLVIPSADKDDREYHKERGENWYPPVNLKNPCNIAGSLHNRL